MSRQPQHFYEFGPYRLIPGEYLLLRAGQRVFLPPKAFETLLVLVESHGHILGKDELLKRIWPDTFVEEVSLSKNVWALRKALGDGEGGESYIETVPRRGYRFVAPVRELPDGPVKGGLAERSQSPVMNTRREGPVAMPSSQEAARMSEAPRWGIGARMKRRAGLAFSLAALLLIGVASAIGLWRLKPQSTAPKAMIKSLAVLPFKPLNRSLDDEYLGIGLADSVITRLSGTGKIIVRSTSAVSKYTASNEDPLAAGREQRVDAVLDSSIWRSGEKIRVTARLLNVRDGMPLWSFQCEELCTDEFKVQTLISERVAEALMPQLAGTERARLTRHYTENREANRLYLLGRYYWNRRTEEGLKRGIECFAQAIDKDPNYALAYAGLAECYYLIPTLTAAAADLREHVAKAKAYASKAIELDEMLAEPHTTLASISTICDWNWSLAEREHKRALELDAGYATAHQRYSLFLMIVGRTEESLAEIRKALELDPVSPSLNTSFGTRLYYARRYDQAIEQLRKALEIEPNRLGAQIALGKVYLQKRMYAEAVAESNKAAAHSRDHALAALGYAWAVSGQRDKAQQALAELQEMSKRRHVWPFDIAAIYTGLGDKDQAIAWLEKAWAERLGGGTGLSFLGIEPQFDPLRSDPRFADLLRRIGLAR